MIRSAGRHHSSSPSCLVTVLEIVPRSTYLSEMSESSYASPAEWLRAHIPNNISHRRFESDHRHYLPPQTVDHLATLESIKRVVHSNTSIQSFRLNEKLVIISYVLANAKRIFLVCINEGLSTNFQVNLIKQGVHDSAGRKSDFHLP